MCASVECVDCWYGDDYGGRVASSSRCTYYAVDRVWLEFECESGECWCLCSYSCDDSWCPAVGAWDVVGDVLDYGAFAELSWFGGGVVGFVEEEVAIVVELCDPLPDYVVRARRRLTIPQARRDNGYW